MTEIISILIVAISIIFVPTLTSPFCLPKLTVLRLCLLIMAGYLLFVSAKDFQKLPKSILYCFMPYTIWLILSSIFALHFNTAFYGVYGWFTGLASHLSWLFLFYVLSTVKIDVIKILKIYVYIMGFVAIYAIFQKLGFDFLPFDHSRPISFSGNAVVMAASLALAVPFCIYFIITSKKWIFVAMLSFILVAIFFSQSRGPQLGLFVSLFLLSIFYMRHFSKRFILSAICFIAIIIILVPLPNKQWNVLIQGDSMQLRLAYWKTAVYMIKDHPITGVGLDNFFNAFPLYRSKEVAKMDIGVMPTQAHNVYVNTAATTGITGLLFYLAFLMSIFWFLIHSYKKSGDKLLIFFITTIVGHLVSDLTGWLHVDLTTYFYLIMGLAVNYANKK